MAVTPQTLMLEKIRPLLWPAMQQGMSQLCPRVDFLEIDGCIVFPIAGSNYFMAYLRCGNYRYGITLDGSETEDDIRRVILRGLHSLRNMMGDKNA